MRLVKLLKTFSVPRHTNLDTTFLFVETKTAYCQIYSIVRKSYTIAKLHRVWACLF